MSITANKAAERARKPNDAQILTMGQRAIGQEAAKAVLNERLV